VVSVERRKTGDGAKRPGGIPTGERRAEVLRCQNDLLQGSALNGTRFKGRDGMVEVERQLVGGASPDRVEGGFLTASEPPAKAKTTPDLEYGLSSRKSEAPEENGRKSGEQRGKRGRRKRKGRRWPIK